MTTETLTFQNFLANCFNKREDQHLKGVVIYDNFIGTTYGSHQSCWELHKQMNPFGFFQAEGWNEGWYRQVWTSDTHLSILTFCEGDVILEVCNDVASYQAEIVRCHNFYVVEHGDYLSGAFTHIDKNCPIAIAAVESQPNTWRYYRLHTFLQNEILGTSPDPQALKPLAIEWFAQNPQGGLKLAYPGGGTIFSSNNLEEEGIFDFPVIVSQEEQKLLREEFRQQLLNKMSDNPSGMVFALAAYSAGDIAENEAVPLDWIKSSLTGVDDRDKAASWLSLDRQRILVVEKANRYDYKGDPFVA